MKWIIIVIMIILMGCALLKKTSRSSAVNVKETSKQTYLDKVDVRTANKETHTYTWWNDSSVYQYQHIREHVDEATLEKLNSSEKALERKKLVKRESSPVKIWMYAGITILIIGFLVVVKRTMNFGQRNAMRP